MKKFLLYAVLFSLSTAISFSQSDVALRIHHKLGIEDFAYDQGAQNNLGHDFKVFRLEYYLSQITVVHDGGMETNVPLDTIALVQPGNETTTTIALGNYPITNIESVKFYIGVPQPTNNEDPTLYPSGHPLAPKAPSMHWGWTAGYRFVAYEGKGGDAFSQIFELHGLGNQNYFQVATDVEVVEENGITYMELIADYIKGLRNINLDEGIVSHGEFNEAKQCLENFRNVVFGNYYLGVENEVPDEKWNIYPNPSSGIITIDTGSFGKVERIEVTTLEGRVLHQLNYTGENKNAIQLNDAGVYLVSIYGNKGVKLATKKVLIE